MRDNLNAAQGETVGNPPLGLAENHSPGGNAHTLGLYGVMHTLGQMILTLGGATGHYIKKKPASKKADRDKSKPLVEGSQMKSSGAPMLSCANSVLIASCCARVAPPWHAKVATTI